MAHQVVSKAVRRALGDGEYLADAAFQSKGIASDVEDKEEELRRLVDGVQHGREQEQKLFELMGQHRPVQELAQSRLDALLKRGGGGGGDGLEAQRQVDEAAAKLDHAAEQLALVSRIVRERAERVPVLQAELDALKLQLKAQPLAARPAIKPTTPDTLTPPTPQTQHTSLGAAFAGLGLSGSLELEALPRSVREETKSPRGEKFTLSSRPVQPPQFKLDAAFLRALSCCGVRQKGPAGAFETPLLTLLAAYYSELRGQRDKRNVGGLDPRA